MPKVLEPNNPVRILAALLLGLLVYNGKCLCDRIATLERNQQCIMVALGISPNGLGAMQESGNIRRLGPVGKNQGNQNTPEVR